MMTSTGTVDAAALLGLLQNPSLNPRAASLLFAAIVVAVLVLVLLVGLLVAASSPSRGGRRAPAPKATVRRRRKRRSRRRATRELWLVVAGWILVITAAGGAAGIVLTDSTTCVRCHKDRLEMSVAKAGHHSEVDCASCHAVPGLGGRIVLGVQVATDFYAASTGEKVPLDERRPRSEACRRCHRGIADSITRKIVRVSHRQFVDEPGWRCIDCHASVGHGPRDLLDDRPRMALCMRCHDGKKASSACSECHPGGITDVRGVSEFDYPQVQLPPVTTCEGCHSMAPCDACHGLRLPHPPGYATAKGHGRAGAFGNRDKCKKCHAREDCAQPDCHPQHLFPGDGHAPDWRQLHATIAPGSEGEKHCAECHREPGFGCATCHK